jgi:MFS family permease
MQFSSNSGRMSPLELRASLALAGIFGLRMLGLFLILPVFAIHAAHLKGGDDQTLVGIALGTYGLTQALLQIPFGMASDRLGRKPVIVFGLALFAAGSFFAASTDDMWLTIIGRSLQGAGAISSAVAAFAADLTREEHRTKAMGMIGASIGLVFALSMVLAPALYQSVGMSGIFSLTGVLALAAIWVVVSVVPPQPPAVAAAPGEKPNLMTVLRNPELIRLNFGIFALHIVLMAIFVIIPTALVRVGDLPVSAHWKVYLPAVLASFALMMPGIRLMEKKGWMKLVFLGCIAAMALIQAGFWLGMAHFYLLVFLLFGFFGVFNILEAALPSLISRFAPPAAKGTAIGVYNTTQTLGLFVGGMAGGWLAQNYGDSAVFVFGFAVIALWGVGASFMSVPPAVSGRRLALGVIADPAGLRARLLALAGVREAIVSVEERAAYLTVNPDLWDEGATLNVLREASGSVS